MVQCSPTTMVSRLYAKNSMSVDELLNRSNANTTAEEPTGKDFCGVGDQKLAADGSKTGSENPGEDDMEGCIEKDLELEAIKEYLIWINRLVVRAGATGVSDRSLSRL
ncbi:hypothetical protein F441_23154 [Phytophthora nicotianae CJ01A1]|uniref:Uncharacterized protein n=1 Tax=Phytophthora nicotianae CJ01A1 TaxID=1317063 RepID=W2VPS8_PHYNI|nr:hypothetical protein F441_23154 [Phytophthora nicotianae CJ01A1]